MDDDDFIEKIIIGSLLFIFVMFMLAGVKWHG
jgi:hypothetical protein